jgi:beta-lactamase regulating signal transducer with metallopeptidase domain
MDASHFDAAQWWHVAGWTMIHFLWLGAIVGAAAGVLYLLLRRCSPNVRYAAALGVLTILSASPLGVAAWVVSTGPAMQFAAMDEGGAGEGARGAGVLDDRVGLTTSEQPAAGTVIELSQSAGATGSARAKLGATGFASVLPATESRSVQPHNPTPGTGKVSGTREWIDTCVAYLPWLWIIGTPLTFALLATGLVGTRRLQSASRLIASGPLADTCARVACSLCVSRSVTLALCERVGAPVLVGIVRPMILLPPAALLGWAPQEVEMVLLHELAHVRRWDNLVNLLQRIVESLLFFHPAVWLVSGWVRREREACCDAIVVQHTQQPQAYAEMLVAIAARLPRRVLFAPAAATALASGSLRSRIRQILKLEDDPMLVSGKSLAVATFTLFVVVPAVVLYWPLGGRAEQTPQPSPIAESADEPATKATQPDRNASLAATPAAGAKRRVTSEDSAEIDLLNSDIRMLEREQSELGGQIEKRQSEFDEALARLKDPAKTKAKIEELVGNDPTLVYLQQQALAHRARWDEQRRQLAGGSSDELANALKKAFQGQLDVQRRRLDEVTKALESSRTQVAALTGEGGHPDSASGHPSHAIGEADENAKWQRAFQVRDDNPLEAKTYIVGGSWRRNDKLFNYFQGLQHDPHGPQVKFFTQWNADKTQVKVRAPKAAQEVIAALIAEADVVADAGAKPLAEAVKEFNAKAQSNPIGRSQPPLTEDEVIAAITGWQRDEGIVSDEVYAIYQKIAETRTLPAEATLDSTTSWVMPSRSFDVWWIDLVVKNTPISGYAHRIRDVKLRSRPLTPEEADELSRIIRKPFAEAELAEWEKLIKQVPLVDAVIARQMWEQLGLKVIPTTDKEDFRAESIRAHFRQQGANADHIRGIKIVGGNLPDGLPVPSYLVDIDGSEFTSYDELLGWRDLEGRSHRIKAMDAQRRFYVFETRRPENSKIQEMMDAGTANGQATRVPPAKSRFPSLDEQKLADLAWKALELELRPLAEDEMSRVREAGYEGGLAVESTGRQGTIGPGSILVGLHVWPTRNLREVADVLRRDDLAELSPLKFYIVQMTGDIETGRIDVNRDALPPPIGPPPTPPPNSNGPLGQVNKESRETARFFEPPTLFDPAQPQPTGGIQPVAAAATQKRSLRYEGKSFNEWRDSWRTELSPDKRLASLKALTAFGANGYGNEAAEVILDVVKEYDWSFIHNEPIGKLQEQAIKALGGSEYGHPSIPWQDWLPLFIAEYRSGNARVRKFAEHLLYQIQPTDANKDIIPELLALSADKEFEPVRASILQGLTKFYARWKDKRIEERLSAALKSGADFEVLTALNALYWLPEDQMLLNVMFDGRPAPNLTTVRDFRPELLVALQTENEDVLEKLLVTLSQIGPKAFPAVPEILPLTLKPPGGEHPIAELAQNAVQSITGSDQALVDYWTKIANDKASPPEKQARATLLLEERGDGARSVREPRR